MKIYFVRHGESEDNLNRIRQRDNSPLSETGLKQANFVAKRLAKLPIDQIIASPFTRTHQTAEAISREINKEIIFSDLFVERKKPSVIEGLPAGDPQGDKIMDEFQKNFYLPDYHYSDEENFFDLKKRAGEAVQFLKQQTAEHVVVVTHGLFLRHLLGVLIFGDQYSQKEAERMLNFRTQNTGISLCEYVPEEVSANSEGWRIEAWNDQAHLG